ncbi:ImmA/IrrE family metallo-endopeptidase [Patulibacter sp. S7RM1-6]
MFVRLNGYTHSSIDELFRTIALKRSMPHLDPELEASGVLRARWSWDNDLPALPIDPIQIARSMGLQVYTASLSEGVSGMLMGGRTGREPKIYLNESDPIQRQRFTCGHELGHWVRHQLLGDTEGLEFVDLRAHLARQGVDSEEIWANRFSAELLMPQKAVAKLLPEWGESGLAFRFNVSLSAMGHRIENLRAAGRLNV